ncbi:MAG: FitA-like ribbon-helix-helix domain-containing protein [Chloroflexota bacterium]
MAVSNLRMPDSVYERLKARAQAEHRSINEVAVEILDRELQRWSAQQAMERARQVREGVRAREGDLPDSTPLLRELRKGRGNRV